jgi:hypothetical protein
VDLLMSFSEVSLWLFRLFLLINLFGHLEHRISKTLESIAVLRLLLSLGLEDADAIKETIKFTWPGPVLLVASWPFHCVDQTIHLPLIVIALGGARLVRVARQLLPLLLSGIEGHLLGQGVLVSDGEHLF